MYALCGIVGILVAGWLFCYLLVKRGQCDSDGLFLLLFAGVGCVIGSHLLYGLTHIRAWDEIANVTSLQEALLLLGTLFGGGVFYGGLIGGISASFLYIRRKKLSSAIFSDCGAICIPLFHTFARIGCFLAGCCYGIEAEWGFAASENPFIPEVVGIHRFPTQLLEAFLNLVLFMILLSLRNTSQLQGHLLHLYLLLYATMRFTVEFLRGDIIRGIWFGLSTSQWISLCLWLISGISLIRAHRQRTHAPDLL